MAIIKKVVTMSGEKYKELLDKARAYDKIIKEENIQEERVVTITTEKEE